METLTNGLMGRDVLALLITNIIAFLILLWLLKKFAWGPLLGMIDARREKIAGDYEAAQGKLDEAEKYRGDFETRLVEIKSLERERVQEAVKRGEAIAHNLEDEARGKARDFLQKAEVTLEHDVAAARLELREQVVDLAIGAAEKLLQEKLDDQKHRQMVERFIQDLGDIRA